MKRKRGTAIVDTDKGIMVVAGKGNTHILPGGGTERKEMRVHAAIRELYEETNLRTNHADVLFSYVGKKHKGYKGEFQDFHTVCLMNVRGTPRPRNEIKKIAYYAPNSKIKISGSTKEIIEQYYKWKEKQTKWHNKLIWIIKRKRFYFQKPGWYEGHIPRKIKNALDKNANFNTTVKIKGKHYEYRLQVKDGGDHGLWFYAKRKLIE